ncbi:MAG: hypothetical protein GX345_00830 [Clostridiales bacterium]|nr:hypothetical protein [Clostridiales bacterium]
MKKRFSSLLAVIMVFALVFSLAACGKNKDDNTSTNGDSTSSEVVSDNISTEDASQGESESQDESESQNESEEDSQASDNTEDDTGSSENGSEKTEPTDKKPQTADEIAAYYNAAANKVKKENPKFTMVLTNIIGDISSSNSMINSLIPRVVPLFSTDPETFNQDTVVDTSIPVYKQNYGGKVQGSSLSKATCDDKGTYYEIRMDFKDEALKSLPTNASVPNTRHGQAFNVLTQEIVDDQVKSFSWIVTLGTFAPTYNKSYIIARIDKATGRMLYTELKCTNTSEVVAKVGFSTLDAKVNFGNKQQFTYKY